MPLSLRRGTVTAVVERVEGLIRLEVDGESCIAYPRLTGEVAIGDDVVVNVQAVALGLGTGGFHVLHANLSRGLDLESPPGAHVMKLPYSSVQHAVRHAEEDGELARDLDGMPVVCCSLHSQLAPACAGLAGARVAYVQLQGGALPVSLSDAVRALKERRLVETSVAVGACFDGDVACVTPWSALAWAKGQGFGAVVCSVGPGIVGTASLLGHGGMAAATAIAAARHLGGAPVLAVRASERDERDRHTGVSHHTQAVLALAGDGVRVPWPRGYAGAPAGAEIVDVDGWREACAGLPLSHMGRGADADPVFFAAAFAAGRAAVAS